MAERWQDGAACKQHPEIDWFPTMDAPGGPTLAHRANTEAAKAVCASCPVRESCLDDALANWPAFGIWGGTTDADRRGMYRPERRRIA